MSFLIRLQVLDLIQAYRDYSVMYELCDPTIYPDGEQLVYMLNFDKAMDSYKTIVQKLSELIK